MIDERSVAGFRHDALLYLGQDDFVDRIAPIVLDGIAAGEPTLVIVSKPRIDALRDRIGTGGDGLVEYRDMRVVGSNPARIIPAWDEFAADQSHDRAVRTRGIGEPIWPGMPAAQLAECHWHEALINRAFADLQGFWLICPYDVTGLDARVVDDARVTHPRVVETGDMMTATDGPGSDRIDVPLTPLTPSTSPLAEALSIRHEMAFDSTELGTLRSRVAAEGARAGLSLSRLKDLILAVSEVATNSIAHGGGRGVARTWLDGNDVVCEIRDSGVITDPLADRVRPGADLTHARGLWTANQLCDLVQVRSSPEMGSVVRLHMHTPGAAS